MTKQTTIVVNGSLRVNISTCLVFSVSLLFKCYIISAFPSSMITKDESHRAILETCMRVFNCNITKILGSNEAIGKSEHTFNQTLQFLTECHFIQHTNNALLLFSKTQLPNHHPESFNPSPAGPGYALPSEEAN